MKNLIYIGLILFLNDYPTTGSLEKFDKKLDEIIDVNSKIEIISSGYKWSEGPLAIDDYLLFSDVPTNTVYKWTPKDGAKPYLYPSGFSGNNSKSKEPGSNGLALDAKRRLILSQHGNRQIARMDAELETPSPKFVSIANSFQDKKLNSPNDLAIAKNGDIYFTDPPYGLPTQSDNDPTKELSFNGVYKISKNNKLQLLVDSLTRPNGIAIFPDQKKLLVANSDPQKSNWYIYEIDNSGLKNGKIFYHLRDPKLPGSPDGLKINSKGIVFASGPGGILIFDAKANFLGRIKLQYPASNCALSPDEKTLYITNNHQILRVKLK